MRSTSTFKGDVWKFNFVVIYFVSITKHFCKNEAKQKPALPETTSCHVDA